MSVVGVWGIRFSGAVYLKMMYSIFFIQTNNHQEMSQNISPTRHLPLQITNHEVYTTNQSNAPYSSLTTQHTTSPSQYILSPLQSRATLSTSGIGSVSGTEADPCHVIDVDAQVDPEKSWIKRDPYQWTVSTVNQLNLACDLISRIWQICKIKMRKIYCRACSLVSGTS